MLGCFLFTLSLIFSGPFSCIGWFGCRRNGGRLRRISRVINGLLVGGTFLFLFLYVNVVNIEYLRFLVPDIQRYRILMVNEKMVFLIGYKQ